MVPTATTSRMLPTHPRPLPSHLLLRPRKPPKRGPGSPFAGRGSCGEPRQPEVTYQPIYFEGRSMNEDEKRVRVRFSVSFRCHSRQMLCMGGSQYPFGWSFVSIAKAPMTWNPSDIWTAEVDLPLGMRVEYKYVILEEQVGRTLMASMKPLDNMQLWAFVKRPCKVWTKQEDEDSEGVVEVTYRTSNQPSQPPDVRTIRKQMAIVDWQPGPNRVLEVPTEEELAQLKPGVLVQRPLFRQRSKFLALQKIRNITRNGDRASMGTWEELFIDKDGTAVLTRRDEWLHMGPGLSCDSSRRLFLGD